MTSSSSTLTGGYVDLATFDEVDKYLYGGQQATTYFVREVRKATWFTQVPVQLTRTGIPMFGTDWNVTVSRAADYLMHVWLRVKTPSITLKDTNQFGPNGRIHWCKNLMHNLVEQIELAFNDMCAQKFDSHYLDFWAAFTVSASKREGYNNMIGNIDALVAPHPPNVPLPERVLNLPLPFFFTRDSGVSLPTSTLPYNDILLKIKYRRWQELLVLENSVPVFQQSPYATSINIPTDIAQEPTIEQSNVWANYAIVSNEERSRMGCVPRDIAVEQVQTSPRWMCEPSRNNIPRYDIRFSHAIKVFFFAVVNTTHPNIRSNYTAGSPVPGPSVDNYVPSNAVDPIESATLTYDNTDRLSNMGSDYFSLVEPFFKAPSIPLETGHHMYSYSLAFNELEPLGSTNFGRLQNVTISPVLSQAAIRGQDGSGVAGSGADYPQKFSFIVVGVNTNIIRISGGALGFPVI